MDDCQLLALVYEYPLSRLNSFSSNFGH